MVNLFGNHLQDYTDHYFKPEVLIIKIKIRGCIKIKPLTASLIQPLFEFITVNFLLSIDSRKLTVINSKRGCIKEAVSGFILMQPLIFILIIRTSGLK